MCGTNKAISHAPSKRKLSLFEAPHLKILKILKQEHWGTKLKTCVWRKPFNMTAIIFSIWLDWIWLVEITFFQIFLGSYQRDVVATWDPQIIGPIAGGNKLENICSIKWITKLELQSTKNMN